MADDEVDNSAALDAERLRQCEDREKRAEGAFRSGKPADALKIALENPPFLSKDQALKDRASALAARGIIALGSRDAELTAFLGSITADEADVLMKYLYKALSKPESSGILLKVHALLVEKQGIGCIVRAIVDRKGPLSQA